MNPLEENDSHSHLFRLPALNPLRSSLDWTLFMSLFELPGLMVMFSPFTLSDCWDSNAKPNPEKSVGFQQSKKKNWATLRNLPGKVCLRRMQGNGCFWMPQLI